MRMMPALRESGSETPFLRGLVMFLVPAVVAILLVGPALAPTTQAAPDLAATAEAAPASPTAVGTPAPSAPVSPDTPASPPAAEVSSAGTSAGTVVSEDDLPSDLRDSLEAALQKKATDLLAEKDDKGNSTKRGNYSKLFHRIDDRTYLASFHVQRIDGNRLVTERYQLRLEPDSGGKWGITDEQLEDTYEGLSRTDWDDRVYRAFDGISFDQEGMKVTGGSGTYWAIKRDGKISRIVLDANGLRFEYEPPVPKFEALFHKLERDETKDVVFDPDNLMLSCDAVSCEKLLAECLTGARDITADQLGDKSRKALDDDLKDYEKNRKENPFLGFFVRDEPDRRRWSLTLQTSGGGQAVNLSYDSYGGREVSYSVYGIFESFPFWQKIYAYNSAETRAKNIDPVELERRDDAFDRDYDLQGVDGWVELATKDAEQLQADIKFTLEAKKPMHELLFGINRLTDEQNVRKESKDPTFIVNALQDGDGNDLTWAKLGGTFGVISFPQEIPEGGKVTLRLSFISKGSIRKFTPSYSYMDRGGWLPFVRFGDMITDMDLTVRVPEHYTALGIGTKVSEEVRDGLRISRWVPKSPVNFPTIIFGDYRVTKPDKDCVVTKSDGSTVDVNLWMDKQGGTQSFTIFQYDDAAQTVHAMELPLDPKAPEKRATEACNALKLYQKIYGVDYLYDKLDLVLDPSFSFYGQAPSSIVYLGAGDFLGAGSGAVLTGGSELAKFNRTVVAHEVGHQWWGSLIGNANNRHYWWVESLAEYSSALYVEATEGREAYLKKVAEWRRNVLNSDLQTGVQDVYDLWAGPDGFRSAQAAIYNKGPYAFHILRSIFGDEKFFAFLKRLAQELQGKEIVTRDIQRVAEQSFGGNMEWFFDEWLRGAGQPEYTFKYSVRQTEDGKWLVQGTVDQRVLVGQKKDVLPGEYFKTVIPITVRGESGKEYRVPIKVEGPTSRFQFKVGEAVKDVDFNENGESLAYDVIKERS